ncbi:hypothetical protein SAMN05444162_3655 [Paenibacillaceae bacterium GAS479]|nr:hypothetical protein SAMN05444162_3655 [Paenibacillaceae bacterium GAS479]
MMKKKMTLVGIALLASASLLLGGCQANTSGQDDKGMIPHLTVDLQIPDKLQPGEASRFTILVEENGKPYDEFYKTSFQFWPEDGSSPAVNAEAKLTAPGTYTVTQPAGTEGVYRVKFSGVSTEYEIMPSKRFAIGANAIEHLAELEKQSDAAPAAPAAPHH